MFGSLYSKSKEYDSRRSRICSTVSGILIFPLIIGFSKQSTGANIHFFLTLFYKDVVTNIQLPSEVCIFVSLREKEAELTDFPKQVILLVAFQGISNYFLPAKAQKPASFEPIFLQ